MGKSDLGVLLAKHFGGEVVSADSRQVYRGLDIGSGKIAGKEMQGVEHHLLDIRDPKRTYSVAHFQRDARKVVRGILKRGKIPIVVGGTGFYLDALFTDMTLPKVKPDVALRKQLEMLKTNELITKLIAIDQRRADKIDTNNRVRLIRAIEIATHHGPVAPITTSSPYDVLYIGLRTSDNELLRERIMKRLAKRLRQGMLAEFKQLNQQGLSWKRMEMLGLEYRFGARLMQKQITKKEFIAQLSSEIYKYAKRQMTWFKRNKNIFWFDIKNVAEIETFVDRWISP